MSVFKYVSPAAAIRYLTSWALRITPPDQFNDPFELRPLIELDPPAFRAEAPVRVRKDLAAQLLKAYPNANKHPLLGEDFPDLMFGYLMGQLSSEDEDRLLDALTVATGSVEAVATVKEARPKFAALYQHLVTSAEAAIPTLVQEFQGAMHQALPKYIGILCLSGSSRHPLMWAHYTDCHKGALLEFDETAPCFDRRRADSDEFGSLRRVCYADARPLIGHTSGAEAGVALALTKALEWAYEQERRLLWPLELADRTVSLEDGSSVHLIDVPPSAVRSVTLGCRASNTFREEVTSILRTASSQAIALRIASVDSRSFGLNYQPVE